MKPKLAPVALALAAVGVWLAPVTARAEPPPAHGTGVPGVPAEAPAAAHAPEPALPAPAAWPFGESFPRTSGTGRLAGGALFWSDFLYDDHGATAQGLKWYMGQYRVAGTYSYPGASSLVPGTGIGGDNAADVFRAAIGVDRDATWWRVDWNTLVDADHPIAAWGLGDEDTAVRDWPGVPGLRAQGVQSVLLVSSRGAWLLDRLGNRTAVATPGRGLFVDTVARSFVLRVPKPALDPAAVRTVRLVSGVADAEGDGFAPVGPDLGGAPGLPPVYNATFRPAATERAAQEELLGSKVRGLYADKAQAAALTAGDITPFAVDVDWRRLGRREATPEPQIAGSSNRWYVSSLELGQGVVNSYSGFSDSQPNLLGRVQPYTVYVPRSYRADEPAPVVFLLHPNGSTHNEYVDSPELLEAACEARGSLCVTTAQRGPDVYAVGAGQLDFWEVWHHLATTFAVDAERVSLLAFSQGGGGVNQLVMAYPDLFARAVVFSPGCCGDVDAVENLRWVPIFVADNSADPTLATALRQADRLDGLGYRHRFELYPTEDHLTFGYKDAYRRGAEYLGSGEARRTRNPGTVTYRWTHRDDRPDLGFGAQGAYWIRRPIARDRALGARVHAVSAARPQSSYRVERRVEPVVLGRPAVAVARELTWSTTAPPPAPEQRLDLVLSNVAELTVLAEGAGLDLTRSPALHVTTDGPVTVHVVDGRRRSTHRFTAGQHPPRSMQPE